MTVVEDETGYVRGAFCHRCGQYTNVDELTEVDDIGFVCPDCLEEIDNDR